jgi:branched-chain amino acid transport system permease protein
MAVIGGLVRIEGAWVGAFVFILMNNYITSNTHIPLLGFGGTLFGGTFNTVIGIIFLAIVVVSPNGLMGLWDRLFQPGQSLRWKRTAPGAEPAR